MNIFSRLFFTRALHTHAKPLLVAIAVLCISVPLVWAESTKNADGLWEFKKGDAIKSEEVNENFATLDQRLSPFESAFGITNGVLQDVRNRSARFFNDSTVSQLNVVGKGDGATYSSLELGDPAGNLWHFGYGMLERNLIISNNYNFGASLILKPNGQVRIGDLPPRDGGTGGSLYVNGQVTAANYTSLSDSRLKHDIKPLEGGLSGIQCLQGVTYQWNDPKASQERQIGLIAQDVERCFPELVSTDAQGYKSVAYDRLVAPLIEAVKFQQAQLQVLQQQNMVMMNRLVALEDKTGLRQGGSVRR